MTDATAAPTNKASQLSNQAIISHLQKAAQTPQMGCTTDELFGLFGLDGEGRQQFAKRMHYLSFKGAVKNLREAPKTAMWAVASLQQPGPLADAHTPPIAQPRRVDVMHSPVYVPTTVVPPRADSLVSTQLPSVGLRC